MGTRDDLVRVGADLLEREGLGAVGLRRIAAEAGVSHGAPRYHFPTFGTLLAAIARTGVDDLDAALSPCWAHPDPRAGVAQAARVYVEFAVARPDMFELIFRHDLLEGQGAHLREVTARWFADLARLVTRVSGDDDPHRAAAVWSGVHGVAVLNARRTTEPVADGGLAIEPTLGLLVSSLLGEGAA